MASVGAKLIKIRFLKGWKGVLLLLIISSAATLSSYFCKSNFLTAICHCFL